MPLTNRRQGNPKETQKRSKGSGYIPKKSPKKLLATNGDTKGNQWISKEGIRNHSEEKPLRLDPTPDLVLKNSQLEVLGGPAVVGHAALL